MYEELLPFWKERCRYVSDITLKVSRLLPFWKERCRYVSDITLKVSRWDHELKSRNLTREWVYRHKDGFPDCIVQGVMLFTWEIGMEP